MPAPGRGRQFLFHLSHAAAFALLEFISSWLMGKIEDSLFEQDCKELEPAIQAALDQQQAKIAGLVRTRGVLYANVRMDVVRNSANLMLVSRHPFTYSFPLGTPVMEPDMPVGFQPVLDYVATVLQDVQRRYSIGGPRFDELNASVDTALRSLGKTWEPDWAETLFETDAKRFGVVQTAVERAQLSAQTLFGANPSPDERQVLAKLGVVALQLKALDDSWPKTLDDGTWRGSTP
jgi:hypothetical protein